MTKVREAPLTWLDRARRLSQSSRDDAGKEAVEFMLLGERHGPRVLPPEPPHRADAVPYFYEPFLAAFDPDLLRYNPAAARIRSASR